MAWYSYPFDHQAITETDYSQLVDELAGGSGIVDGFGWNGFAVGADGSRMAVVLGPGMAIVRGHVVHSTEPVAIPIGPASATLARVDRLVLRLDPSCDSIDPVVIEGEPGRGVPELYQTSSGPYDLPVAQINVEPCTATIAATDVVDDRRYLGGRVGIWATSTRPDEPRPARMGYNTDLRTWEYWTGASWTSMGCPSWDAIAGRPETFPPAEHEHDWCDVVNKPQVFAPAPHTHEWWQLKSKPVVFPPEAHRHHASDINGAGEFFARAKHKHQWTQITGVPKGFPPEPHEHSEYVKADGTIHRAEGTANVHTNTVQGNNTLAVWVDAEGNFGRNVSSERYKENIRDHAIEAEKVLKLRPVLYDMRPVEGADGPPAKGQFGLIAEEVVKVFPEVVTLNADGKPETVRYDLLSVVLIGAIADLKSQITDLAGAATSKARRWWQFWRKS
jgi:hypothetical protein